MNKKATTAVALTTAVCGFCGGWSVSAMTDTSQNQEDTFVSTADRQWVHNAEMLKSHVGSQLPISQASSLFQSPDERLNGIIIIPEHEEHSFDREIVDNTVDYLIDDAERFGIEYVMWDQSYIPAVGEPQQMEDRGSDWDNHRTRLFIALSDKEVISDAE
ncbi:hypothetical protein [Corynebacterium sputi]|uniref:hypothetical protein n=1 Tax=Corynebacterium sputi TaxID=489915 RepID=UPI0012EC847D|nr:hypothetical protein [Corynebacterium sputi]